VVGGALFIGNANAALLNKRTCPVYRDGVVGDVAAELGAGEVDGFACFEGEIAGFPEGVGEGGYGEDAASAGHELAVVVDSSSGVKDFDGAVACECFGVFDSVDGDSFFGSAGVAG